MSSVKTLYNANKLKNAVTRVIRVNKYFFLVLLVSVLSFSLSSWLNMMYILPSGTDPALWLRYSRVLVGDTASFWSWDPLSRPLAYPPLALIILIGLTEVTGNELLAVKLLGSIAIAFIPLTTYLLVRKIFGSETKALIACFFTGLSPSLFEMWSWGAYPNLLAMGLFPLVFYFVLPITGKPTVRNVTMATIISTVIAYTHHLSVFVLFSILLLYMFFLVLCSLLQRKSIPGKPILALFVIMALTTTFSMPLLVVQRETFTVSNVAAKAFIIKPEILLFLFKSFWLLGFIIALAVVYFIIIFVKRLVTQETLLLGAWLLAPLLLTQLYLVNVYVDYNRFPFFSIQPLLIVIAGLYGGFEVKIRFRFLKKLLSFLVILTLALSNVYGAATAIGASQYYHYVLTNNESWWSDKDLYEAISWLEHNTPSNATILTGEYIGIWVRGIANVKAALPEPVKFIFVKELIEASMDAKTMLTSDYEARNEFLQLREGLRTLEDYELSLGMYNGEEYQKAIQLWDRDIHIGLVDSSGERSLISLSATDIESSSIQNNVEFVKFLTNYRTQNIFVSMSAELPSHKPDANFFLNISLPGNSEAKITKFWMTFYALPDLFLGNFNVTGNVASIYGKKVAVEFIFSTENLESVRQQRSTTLSTSAFYNLTEPSRELSLNVTMHFVTDQKAPPEVRKGQTLCFVSKDDLLKKYNVKYVLLLLFDPHLNNFEVDQRFELVYKNAKAKIFSLKPESESSD